MTRTAIIGTGWIAHEHVLALRGIPGVDIVAVSSSDLDRAREFARDHDIPLALAPHMEAPAIPQLDAVHICTKNAEHFAQCRLAIENGKHVVAEKPLAANSEETAVLLQLAHDRGIVHSCNYHYRAYPMVQYARELIARGELGDVQLVQGCYTQDWLLQANDYNWRLDPGDGGMSGAFGDVGSHWFDLMEQVTGHRITEVHSRLRTAVPERIVELNGSTKTIPIEMDDCGVVSFELDNGSVGSAVVSQVAAGRKNRLWLEVSGSKTSIGWSQEEPDQLWVGHRDRANELLMRDVRMTSDEVLPPGHPFGWRDAIRRNLRSVYHRIGNSNGARNELVPFATFSDGHRSLQLVEAVVRSAAEKAALRLEMPVGTPGAQRA